MNNEIIEQFRNPSSEYRGKPFWCWNGKLEKEELLRQITVMKEMGMGGYFCHSRTGLDTEYLGDEWFDLINACADMGEKLGMETWLYDEDRWPSGTAGGMVTQDPQYRMKFIRLSIIPGNDFLWTNDVIAVFSADVEELSFTNKRAVNINENVKGKTLLVFTIEEMGRDGFYNGFTYVDTLNKEATNKFIEITHEKYKEKCGDRLGKSIKGIFTDEPHRGSAFCGCSMANANPYWMIPYTDELFEKYKQTYDYDLRDYLPELFLQKDGEKISQIKWHYMDMVQQLFIDNFLKPINDWCMSNNIILTGHVLHEDSLSAQACMVGSVMRCYEYMEYPGVDVLSEFNQNYWIVKQLSSAARQLGKKWILSELYGCTGWQMDFEGHKAVGDWQALLGINLRCQHLSWYTMAGEAKRDYPASILHQSAWYKDYKFIEDYYSRINLMMMQGENQCDLLVLNPVESTWCSVYPNWASWRLDAVDEDIKKIEEMYRDVFHILNAAKIDFDYGDEEMLSRLYSIEVDNEIPYLKVGKVKYKAVLAAGMLTIRKSTLDILSAFIHAGGKVVFAGDLPQYVDAVKSDNASKINALNIPFNESSIIKEMPQNSIVSIKSQNTDEPISDICVQVKTVDNGYMFLFMNLNRKEEYKNVKILFKTGGYLERWDVRTGEIHLECYSENGFELITDFEPIEEKLFVLTDKNNDLKKTDNLTIDRVIPLTQSFEYSLAEKNILVLDYARYKIEDGEWLEETEILKIDQALRNIYGLSHRGGGMIQPWFSGKKVCKTLGNITLQYDVFVEDIPEDSSLILETPQLFDIKVNDNAVDTLSEYEPWIDICYRIIPLNKNYFKKGKNTITCNFNFTEDLNIEAMYLYGDFSVRLNGLNKTIEKAPEMIKFGSIVEQGFPFYGAGISYKIKEIPEIAERERLFLSLDDFEGAYVKISNGTKEKVIAFKPFEADITDLLDKDTKELEIEYVLTRRNTFGPLHINPAVVYAVGPESFLTEGERFMYNSYSLLPQGMTGKIDFVIKS